MQRGMATWRSMLVTLTSLGLVTGGSLMMSASPAAASGIEVYVGYADTAHGVSPDNFPTPWQGSPNTIYQGCPSATACQFDAGAVRIVNSTGSLVTVNAVAVHVGSCTFSGWPSTPLPAGSELIVTQTAIIAAEGCLGPAQLDSSDVDLLPSCVPNGIVPAVDVTVNGTTTTYIDSGQVLNTGGLDGGACSGNESTQWTTIGHAPCKGALLTLAPPEQSHPVLSTATVTASFTNSCGQPLSNVQVDFSIASGPNAGMTHSGVTDANGQTSFTYSSSQVGTDTLGATITNLVGSIASNSVTASWTVNFAPGGGAFVIGDLENIQGAGVYWWGAQWWKNDHLSTGLAPASFKGYENGNASPWCGQTWTARPGNSSPPPKAVAAESEMAVIVSSTISKSGPTMSGDIVAIVLVRTNAGYGPNPGHPGTGTILSTICSQAGTPLAAPAGNGPLTGHNGGLPPAAAARTGPAVSAPQPQSPKPAGSAAPADLRHGAKGAATVPPGKAKGHQR